MLKSGKLFLSLLAVTALISSTASAESLLNAKQIKKFYKESAESSYTMKGNAAYIKKHMHKDGTISMKIDVIMPMSPKQIINVQFTKQEMLDSLMADDQMGVTVEKAENTVLKVNISKDGKTAKVTDMNYVISRVTVDSPQGQIDMSIELKGICDDELLITKSGLIQIFKSVCNLEQVIKPKM